MNEVSPMSSQPTLLDLPSATFSPELVDGPLRLTLPDGIVHAPSGLVPARVSRTRQRASNSETPTPGISGRTSSGSSASVALTACLASKLAQRLARVGSMEYRQTWKERVTPSGRVYWEHTALTVRTSDNDFTGYPTPQTHDTQEQGKGRPLTDTGRILCHNGDTHSLNLPGVAQLSGYPTCKVSDTTGAKQPENRTGGMDLKGVAQLSGYSTPTAQDHSRGSLPPRSTDTGVPLSQQVAMVAGYCTPSARDWKDTPGMAETGTNPDGSTRQRNDQLPRPLAGAVGVTSTSSTSETGKRGALSSVLPCWLMGFNVEWLEALAKVQPKAKSRRR